jgi:hypothetical protein
MGLCFMEWSCFRCDDDPYNVKAKGLIAELQNLDSLNTYNRVVEINDTITYSKLVVSLVLNTERVAEKYVSFASSLYATSCDGPYPLLIDKLDSIKIFSKTRNGITETTDLFSHIGGNTYNPDTTQLKNMNDINTLFGGGYHLGLSSFFLSSSPSSFGETEFIFRLYHNGKDSLETTTDPIVIKP